LSRSPPSAPSLTPSQPNRFNRWDHRRVAPGRFVQLGWDGALQRMFGAVLFAGHSIWLKNDYIANRVEPGCTLLLLVFR
jgi:hypothetical protein